MALTKQAFATGAKTLVLATLSTVAWDLWRKRVVTSTLCVLQLLAALQR